MTHSRPTVRELLTSRGLAPRRDLGQNFVADPNTVRRIAHLAGVGPTDHVVEIGAGLGSLTLALAETGAAVTAVEVDRGSRRRSLREVVADVPDVRVVEADAMTLDWAALLAGHVGWVLVANLPYNVATPLVLRPARRRAGDRADARDGPARGRRAARAAPAGSAPYGAVSVKVAYWATARIVGDVPASVFMPKPKVESALVEIVRRAAARRGPRRAVLARAHGVRAAPQDAAPIAGRRGRPAEQFVAADVARDGATRGARPRRLGAG